ncbi:MAG: hypothetical protein ACREQI_12485 [Candidatus Binataceae bacterium]
MSIPRFSFETWVKWVFDHSVAAKGEKEWWFCVPDADEGGRWLDRPPWRVINYMTRLFEDPVPPLKPYSDEQIDQGLWFIFNNSNSRHIDCLHSEQVSLAHRRRCIRAIAPLYRKLILPRSAEEIQACLNPPGRPLNSIGYMLWDIVCDASWRPWEPMKRRRIAKRAFGGRAGGSPYFPKDLKIKREILCTLSELVTVPHLAGQEAAIHGLGHIEQELRGSSREIIDRFLAEHPDLHPKLREYALQAREGKIQ